MGVLEGRIRYVFYGDEREEKKDGDFEASSSSESESEVSGLDASSDDDGEEDVRLPAHAICGPGGELLPHWAPHLLYSHTRLQV
jgi:hypothetical protein